MKAIFICLFLIPLCVAQGLGQSVTTVEVYGSVPAIQAYNGLGSNLTQANAWEYAALQALHGSWARNDCGWTAVELTIGTYTMPSGCAAALTNSSTYGIHPMLDALYGPPYATIASGTLAAASIGATTATITVGVGSIAGVVPGRTEMFINPQWATKASYPGVLITGISGNVLTLAAAATINVAASTPVGIDLLFYPPVLIPPGQGYKAYQSNPSVIAYANYAHYLATQIAAAGLTGEVSLWNEPPWQGDPWDNGTNLYDTPPSNGEIYPAAAGPGLGVELPFYVANRASPVAGVPYDSGYPNTSGEAGDLLFSNWTAWMENLFTYKSNFATQSFHPYGNNPEDAMWLGNACLAANPNTFFTTCTPVGAVSGASEKGAVYSSMVKTVFGGTPHAITETGLCTTCVGASNTTVTRFDLRQFLGFQALGVTPILFYRMYDDSGSGFGWMASQGNPLPVYTAFQGLMTDIGAISNPPVAPYSQCMMPRVSSYTGYYPLATMTFVGSQAGNKANSLLYYTYQRTYTSGSWFALASPASVNVSVVVPTGLTVSSVKDTLTGSGVSFTFSGGTLTYAVADDPVEILLVPSNIATQAALGCT